MSTSTRILAGTVITLFIAGFAEFLSTILNVDFTTVLAILATAGAAMAHIQLNERK